MVYACGRGTLSKTKNRKITRRSQGRSYVCTVGSKNRKGVTPKLHDAILLVTVAFMTTKAIMKQ